MILDNKKLEEAILSGRPVEIPHELREWLASTKLLFVDQKWRAGVKGRTFSTLQPATGEVLANIAIAEKEDCDLAVKSARAAFERGEWSQRNLVERAAIVKKLGDLVLENRATLALLESLDTGKPIRETFDGDIPRSASNFHFFSEFGAVQEDRVYTSGNDTHRAFREPLGVVVLITPWNLPLYLETWKIAPALLMGNSVILKPSELTPITAVYFTELVEKAGLPKGVFQLVQGFGEKEAGEFLVSHPGIDAISFTGETGTGRAIMRSAAVGPTRVSFELGGKGASIVYEDADFDSTVEETVRAAFRNQGEICLACPRVFVQKSIYKKFVDAYVARVKKIKLGDPLSYETTMGALISEDHRDKVESYLNRVEDKTSVLTGGGRPKNLPKGFFLEPTVLAGLNAEHPVNREEIFGPVVSILPFETLEEAVALTNDTPYGLSASIYTTDLKKAEATAKRIRIGLVWINCWFARDLRVPFGGQKRSGVGREGGTHSLDFFSEWKSVCTRGGQK